jgi:hypothetical protein
MVRYFLSQQVKNTRYQIECTLDARTRNFDICTNEICNAISVRMPQGEPSSMPFHDKV